MPPLPDALAAWHDFYYLLGSAAATMVALLFVAASVGSGVFTGQVAPLRVFLSASVVNFGVILALSLIALAPETQWLALGLLILACGGFGLFHSWLGWRAAVREALLHRIDIEDRIWYLMLPSVGYACVVAAAVVLMLAERAGCAVLALAAGILMITGVHNAWDITIWVITRRRE